MFKKKEEDLQYEYSKDADQSRYIKSVVALCFLVVIGIFAIEILAFFVPRENAFLMTAELIHTLLNLTIPILTGIGGFLWGKSKAAEEAAKLKEQLNGHNQEKKQ